MSEAASPACRLAGLLTCSYGGSQFLAIWRPHLGNAQIRGLCLAFGILASIIGGSVCTAGPGDSLAAQHEKTTVGRVVGVSSGTRGSHTYHYVFSINGVKYDDFSNVCLTPLAPNACTNNGPVLVYYTLQPQQRSRLQDFAEASEQDYGLGITALVIGSGLLIGVAIAKFKEKRDMAAAGEPDPDQQEGASKSGGMPDDIHIVPGE